MFELDIEGFTAYSVFRSAKHLKWKGFTASPAFRSVRKASDADR